MSSKGCWKGSIGLARCDEKGCPFGHPFRFSTIALTNGSVVLVAVDATGFLVLLRMQGLAIPCGQVTVILGTHPALFAVDACLLVLKARGFARRQLAALHSLRNAILLVDLTLVDVVVVCPRCGGWGLGNDCHRREDQSGGKNSREKSHLTLLFLSAGFTSSLPLAHIDPM